MLVIVLSSFGSHSDVMAPLRDVLNIVFSGELFIMSAWSDGKILFGVPNDSLVPKADCVELGGWRSSTLRANADTTRKSIWTTINWLSHSWPTSKIFLFHTIRRQFLILLLITQSVPQNLKKKSLDTTFNERSHIQESNNKPLSKAKGHKRPVHLRVMGA